MLDLLERQERLTVNQWKVVTAAILGGALGSLAFLLPSFALGVASALRHLTYARSPLIHLSTGVGTVLGGIFWGWMADRIGRRKAFIATVLNVSLASGIMAATPDQGALMFLTVCFLLAAFGASGLFVTLLPLVQEFVPASKRGWIGGLGNRHDFVGDVCIAAGSTTGCAYRLARSFRSRLTPGVGHAVDPRLGSRVSALADPQRAARGRQTIAVLGPPNRP
jgi:MFS family permease